MKTKASLSRIDPLVYQVSDPAHRHGRRVETGPDRMCSHGTDLKLGVRPPPQSNGEPAMAGRTAVGYLARVATTALQS